VHDLGACAAALLLLSVQVQHDATAPAGEGGVVAEGVDAIEGACGGGVQQVLRGGLIPCQAQREGPQTLPARFEQALEPVGLGGTAPSGHRQPP
jgi:hypothetical protein